MQPGVSAPDFPSGAWTSSRSRPSRSLMSWIRQHSRRCYAVCTTLPTVRPVSPRTRPINAVAVTIAIGLAPFSIVGEAKAMNTLAFRPAQRRRAGRSIAAAGRLGVGYSTFKRWIHTGRVRTTRTAGGHHRVSETELERLAARHGPTPSRRPQVADDESLAGLSA